MNSDKTISRRQWMGLAGTLGAGLALAPGILAAAKPIRKPIISSGEPLPVIGMGTSRTFDASGDPQLLTRLEQVTQTFFDMGGGMIDSSPMYGSSEDVIGQLLPKVNGKQTLFAATKVWTRGQQPGIEQMEASRKSWGVQRFDLMQIHNLVDWRIHLETLKQMKADGQIRYIGITTSHGRFHSELNSLLKEHDFDFLQLSYNIANRDVESNLLPLARQRGISVIVNRPYQRGGLFSKVKGKTLPAWAQEFDCNSWGQFFLKFVVSHPAVTCAIPATTKVKHMQDNMRAGQGRLPDPAQRKKMLGFFQSL